MLTHSPLKPAGLANGLPISFAQAMFCCFWVTWAPAKAS